MKASKDAVATHEAGHAIVVLATPLRDFVKEARIYFEQEHWFGHVALDGRDRNAIDHACVLEFAKGLAGPMAQIHFFPDSISQDLQALVRKSGSLLRAVKRIRREQLPISANWGPDLSDWIRHCSNETSHEGADFLAIEMEIDRFLRSDVGAQAVSELAMWLAREESLNRDRLLSVRTDHLPEFHFPDELRIY